MFKWKKEAKYYKRKHQEETELVLNLQSNVDALLDDQRQLEINVEYLRNLNNKKSASIHKIKEHAANLASIIYKQKLEIKALQRKVDKLQRDLAHHPEVKEPSVWLDIDPSRNGHGYGTTYKVTVYKNDKAHDEYLIESDINKACSRIHSIYDLYKASYARVNALGLGQGLVDNLEYYHEDMTIRKVYMTKNGVRYA